MQIVKNTTILFEPFFYFVTRIVVVYTKKIVGSQLTAHNQHKN